MSTVAIQAQRLETLYEEQRVLNLMFDYYRERWPIVCREIDALT